MTAGVHPPKKLLNVNEKKNQSILASKIIDVRNQTFALGTKAYFVHSIYLPGTGLTFKSLQKRESTFKMLKDAYL